MLRYVILNKKIGETPLLAMNAWRARHPEYVEVAATYAGRLDPMASGKLLILLGEECKKREEYTGLDKQYEIEVLLGIGTDSGDALGLPAVGHAIHPARQDIERACRSLTGSHTVLYPPFSSKTVNGIPLFQYALESRLNEIDIPKHTETVYKVQLNECQEISGKQLLDRIQTHLAHVPRTDDPAKRLGADFRQDQVRTAWVKALGNSTNTLFPIARLTVTCASGTYMRTLANRLGTELGTTGFALSIHRTKIGTYREVGPFGFWTKQY